MTRFAPVVSLATVQCACGCGTVFPRFDNTNRPRRFVSGHNLRPQEVSHG